MAESAAAARREARMRRILTNSESRLKRITEDKKYEEIKNDFTSYTSNSFAHTIEDTTLISEEPEVPSLYKLLEENEAIQKTMQESSTNYLQARIVMLISLALITRYLSYIIVKTEDIFNIDLINLQMEYIFGPFLMFKVFDLIFIHPNLPNNNLNLLFMFATANQKNVQYLLKLLNFVTNVMVDLSVYFFFFTIVDMCIYIITTALT